MAKKTSSINLTLTQQQRLDWLQLLRTENIGPINFYGLLKRFGSAENALSSLPEITQRNGLSRPLKIYPREQAEAELEHHEKIDAHLISIEDPVYPSALKQLDNAPPLLSIMGDVALLNRPTFAVVGARNASINGKKLAAYFASQLAERGWVIVSGLARGVDAAAHEASLNKGTIAILAGGINNIYPPENENLYHRIKEHGLLVAESPIGTSPQSNLFPRRNRIISGLSQGVLVIEAALESGSLITARFALEQGREVFAVPGTPLDPRSRGTNQLIKEGAILTEDMKILKKNSIPPLLFNAIPSQPSTRSILRL